MRLKRPYIPVNVRHQVIVWQLQKDGRLQDVLGVVRLVMSEGERLDYLLKCKFGDEKYHLDHDPPLCLRHIVDAEKGIYQPDANDPAYLVYRTEEEHRIKTYVRGDGAQLSDAGKRRKRIKQERPDRPSRWPPKGSRPLRWRTS